MIKIGAKILLFSFLFVQCSLTEVPYQTVKGRTMGTTYSIIYQGAENMKSDIDRLLMEINDEVSTYIPSSTISQYNISTSEFEIDSTSNHFMINWEASGKIYQETQGFFDPSVMPLINYWGFGYTSKEARTKVDSNFVEEMMKGVGFSKFQKSGSIFTKPSPDAQLDFSAIAKGYAVDAISDLLNNNEIENYLVEIGREVFTKGQNIQGKKWKIGLSTPDSEAAMDEISLVISVSDRGVASSGNYRNFHIVEGKKYGHTIDPYTGYPSLNDLLGITVISMSCMDSDAYATAFMAMGLEKSMKLVEELPRVEACFFYSDQEGKIIKKYSNGFIQYVAGREE